MIRAVCVALAAFTLSPPVVAREQSTSASLLDTTSNAGLTNGVMGRGVAKSNAIPFLFKSGADTFHNTFTYNPSADSWQWQLDDENGGKITPFARLTLTRK